MVTAPAPPPPPSGPTGASLPARLGSSSGAQYYVDGNAGSDSNPGTSAAPWRSIARAWNAASAGTTINVRAGTYGEQSVLMSKTASASNPITVRAAPGETVSLGGIYVGGVTGLRIQGFRISRPGGDGIKVTDSTGIEVIGNDIYGNGNQGVLVVGDRSSGTSNVQLWSNRIHDNGANGSSSYSHGVYYGGGDGGTRGGVIANNVFYDQPTGYHLQLGPQADGVIVTNNTFATATASYPSGSGIVVWGEGGEHSTRNVVIVNNAFAFNNNMGVQGSGGGTGNVVRTNLGYGNGGGDFEPYYGSSQVFTLGVDNITGSTRGSPTARAMISADRGQPADRPCRRIVCPGNGRQGVRSSWCAGHRCLRALSLTQGDGPTRMSRVGPSLISSSLHLEVEVTGNEPRSRLVSEGDPAQAPQPRR